MTRLVGCGEGTNGSKNDSVYSSSCSPAMISLVSAIFLSNQLKPENFASAAAQAGYPCQLRMQPLYDHSYYMISTFMRDHVDHHARALGLRPKL